MKIIPLSAAHLLSTMRWFMLGVCALAAPALLAQTQVGGSAKSTVKINPLAMASSRLHQKAKDAPVLEAALTPAELLIAQRVEVGTVQCELGQVVEVAADTQAPGYFNVSGKKFRFHMAPVITSTGAIRLEDAKAGAVWLQLSNKSMLMSQKHGSRLADACVTTVQAVVAAAMEKMPPPSLLDTPVLAAQAVPPPMTPTVALSDNPAQ